MSHERDGIAGNDCTNPEKCGVDRLDMPPAVRPKRSNTTSWFGKTKEKDPVDGVLGLGRQGGWGEERAL